MTPRYPEGQQPAPAFAVDEQARAEGLTVRIGCILDDPCNPSRCCLAHYQYAARAAFATAAYHTEQPDLRSL